MRSGSVFFLAIAALLAAGAGRLAYLQYAQGAALRQEVLAQQTAALTIPALRGEILDARGRLLAGSLQRPSVFVDPSQMADVRDLRYGVASIAPVLGLNPAELEARLLERRDSQFVWVKRGVSDEERAAFVEVRDGRRLSAFRLQYEVVRTYPFGELAAHVLGFVGDPQGGVPRGLAGVELAFNEHLTGRDGRRASTVDARRRRLSARADDHVPPQDGAAVVLTLDAFIQQRTEFHLRNAVQTFGAEWGSAIVMDPNSGEVLAMATVPAFDPAAPLPPGLSGEALAQAEQRLLNRAIGHAYEPGSIFKPYVAACALDEQLTRLDEVFTINGPTRDFGRRTIHDTHAYGSLPLHEVISRSSNIGMALLGTRCGNQRLHRYVRLYGFGDRTGLWLPGEHTGLVQDFSRWTGYSTQSIPIGQEIALTGIQVVTGFSVFANGGILLRPRIVRGIVGPDGAVLVDNSRPIAVRRVISVETCERFRQEALVEAVMSKIGTGKNAQIPHYLVFGKTGTAQIARPDGRGYLEGQYVGSFVGGAPAGQPRAVVLVSIYRPNNKERRYYGGTVAAPAVGAILADTLAYLQVPHEVTAAGAQRRVRGAELPGRGGREDDASTGD